MHARTHALSLFLPGIILAFKGLDFCSDKCHAHENMKTAVPTLSSLP
jgi:hypothetical protein